MQVGTSRYSSVSRGADYPFTLTQTREYCFGVVPSLPARIHLPSEHDDLDEAATISMGARRHQTADIRERSKSSRFDDMSGYVSK